MPYEVGVRDASQGGSQGGGDTNIVQVNTGSLSASPATPNDNGSGMISASLVMIIVSIVMNVRL